MRQLCGWSLASFCWWLPFSSVSSPSAGAERCVRVNRRPVLKSLRVDGRSRPKIPVMNPPLRRLTSEPRRQKSSFLTSSWLRRRRSSSAPKLRRAGWYACAAGWQVPTARSGRGLLLLITRDRIDEDTWEEFEATLITSDLGVAPTTELVESLRSKLRVEGISEPGQAKAILRAELIKLVDPTHGPQLSMQTGPSSLRSSWWSE